MAADRACPRLSLGTNADADLLKCFKAGLRDSVRHQTAWLPMVMAWEVAFHRSRFWQEYPSFSEEELYQTGRLIVAGLIARIHTVEWTPALLNNKVLNISMHNNWCAHRRSTARMCQA